MVMQMGSAADYKISIARPLAKALHCHVDHRFGPAAPVLG